ncbi:MAG: hypothetical protein A3J37_01845 [Alphaproteobacteria bacterium RIFCSPHIGHO2_12_FULL_45_9]|nr:MAG: hypothetical protein A3B66_05940 [Alphaproteobacteria bacterium RIFCSPHIGHO2_02_FULL_46_13]OFW98785.1 MAG: hypothetical protein A3J37_01845 [Alphaproteobacteria bacterium RIFCSPHIGHO2_12_FULL_45_9]
MDVCTIDKNECVSLADIFRFVSDFETKTGFRLSDIYQWLNPDITDPEPDEEGYRWEDAIADYHSYQSHPDACKKRVPVDIAAAFFSVCEKYKVYGGARATDIDVHINRPTFAKSHDRVLIKDFKGYLREQKERTEVSNTILWKLLPDEIKSRYSFNTFVDNQKDLSSVATISIELAKAIRDTYSKICGRNQPVDVSEGLVVPPFGSQHSFSVSSKVALPQLNEKFALAKGKGLYATKLDFMNSASILLGVDVSKLFDKSHKAIPRLRVAICLALLEGHTIPSEVLDIHRKYFDDHVRNRPAQSMGRLENE